jgi:hypothetical protein
MFGETELLIAFQSVMWSQGYDFVTYNLAKEKFFLCFRSSVAYVSFIFLILSIIHN